MEGTAHVTFTPCSLAAFIITCTFAAVITYSDVEVWPVLLQSIESELKLSDAEMGFIMGPAQTLVFGSCTLFLGFVNDSALLDRRTLLQLCILAFSTATAWAGFSQGFLHLAVSRSFSAFSEAGVMIVCSSLFGSFVHESQRAKAMSVLTLSWPGGAIVGKLLGGNLNEAFGWRNCFFAFGLLGVPIIFAVWMAVPYSKHTQRQAMQVQGAPTGCKAIRPLCATTMNATLTLCSKKPFIHFLFTLAFCGVGLRAKGAWTPAVLQRLYGMTSAEAGNALAGVAMFGLIGSLMGGCLTDWLCLKCGDGWLVRMVSYPNSIGYACFALSLWMPSPQSFLVVHAFGQWASGLGYPAILTLPLALSSKENRGIAAALGSFSVNVLAGLGPWSVGFYSATITEHTEGHNSLATAHSVRTAVAFALFLGVFILALFACSARAMDQLSAQHEQVKYDLTLA